MPSRRLPTDLTPNAYARARAARGPLPYDLTASNPTVCGFDYPKDLLEPLARPEGLRYRPDPRGLRGAREAVAAEYAARGVAVDPERIVLTASSSEAYGFLFKLLCDPGDAVLAPVPSYPLFEHLATLEGVRVVPYALDIEHDGQPRPPARELASVARAAILVHPNNPTGSWVSPGAAEGLAASPGRALPLIVDEVFLDFPLDGTASPASFAARGAGATYTLGGLSKSRGLPQLKLSWIVASGSGPAADEDFEALTFIADTALSVATPVQEALPEILARSRPVRDAIRTRCAANLAVARRLVRGVPAVAVLPPGGGWSVVLRFPRVVPEEALVLELLEERGVALHPGYFFDFPSEGYLVASLLPPEATFQAGLAAALDAIAAKLG